MNMENYGGLPEYQNLYGETQWLVDLIIAKITEIYGNPSTEVLEFIIDKPLTIAFNPHSLDRFGYRIDSKGWWILL